MFGSSESHLTLDTWMVNREVTLQFKTSNPNGVIAYAGGNSGNYLELELRDGSLFFSARKGEFFHLHQELLAIQTSMEIGISNSPW